LDYNPTEYWTERGKTYYKEKVFNTPEMRLQEEFVLRILKQLRFSSVFEAGCGFGRVTKLLLDNFDVEYYDAIDLSPDQAARARQNNPRANVTVSTIQDFVSNRKYDMVIASEVLLHVRPEDIRNVIMKLLSLSNIHLVHIDWDEENPTPNPEPFNFMHNYGSIYEEMGLQFTRTRVRKKKFLRTIDARQSVFVVNVSEC
jgi:SAM-dependent methyltransferase